MQLRAQGLRTDSYCNSGSLTLTSFHHYMIVDDFLATAQGAGIETSS